MRATSLRTTTWLMLTALLAAAPAHAQAPAQAPAPAPAGPATKPESDPAQETIRKLNAYVGLLNRTLRAQESLGRYQSWVNMKTGPTGRERIIYGLYGLYDVRGEIAKAEAATAQPPAMPDLDGAVKTYIAAYQALAPTVTEAEGYYERQDYRADKMEQGKALHAKLAVAGPAFLAARAKVDAALRVEKERSDALELAAIEAREGRKARWHVANVMTACRKVMDLLPTDAKPVVDMAAFDAALGRYAVAVKDMDGYSAANPNSFHVFESRPRALLGKLREFDDKLAKARGDARRGAGRDVTWIVNDYNMMVSTAQTATTFSR
ncbi:MAG: YiiG family protein [Methylobacterium radiotolerans]